MYKKAAHKMLLKLTLGECSVSEIKLGEIMLRINKIWFARGITDMNVKGVFRWDWIIHVTSTFPNSNE